MRYRPLTDIYPVGYPWLPVEAEVRHQCRVWIDQAYNQYNLLIITGQINQIVNPFLREYTTVIMHDLILREAANPDSDYQFSSTCMESLESDFRRIISNAWTDQLKENLNTAYEWEEGVRHEQDTRDCATLTHSSGENMQLIYQELQHLRQRLERLEHQEDTFRWPFYTAQATDPDKQTFEKLLRKLCLSRSRSHSRDIKLYLAQKEKAGLIVRPTELKQEHTLLSDLFGYQPTYSAYHNA